MAQPGYYIILPCTFAPRIEMPFELSVYTQHKSHIFEVQATKPKTGLPGFWKVITRLYY